MSFLVSLALYFSGSITLSAQTFSICTCCLAFFEGNILKHYVNMQACRYTVHVYMYMYMYADVQQLGDNNRLTVFREVTILPGKLCDGLGFKSRLMIVHSCSHHL